MESVSCSLKLFGPSKLHVLGINVGSAMDEVGQAWMPFDFLLKPEGTSLLFFLLPVWLWYRVMHSLTGGTFNNVELHYGKIDNSSCEYHLSTPVRFHFEPLFFIMLRLVGDYDLTYAILKTVYPKYFVSIWWLSLNIPDFNIMSLKRQILSMLYFHLMLCTPVIWHKIFKTRDDLLYVFDQFILFC